MHKTILLVIVLACVTSASAFEIIDSQLVDNDNVKIARNTLTTTYPNTNFTAQESYLLFNISVNLSHDLSPVGFLYMGLYSANASGQDKLIALSNDYYGVGNITVNPTLFNYSFKGILILEGTEYYINIYDNQSENNGKFYQVQAGSPQERGGYSQDNETWLYANKRFYFLNYGDSFNIKFNSTHDENVFGRVPETYTSNLSFNISEDYDLAGYLVVDGVEYEGTVVSRNSTNAIITYDYTPPTNISIGKGILSFNYNISIGGGLFNYTSRQFNQTYYNVSVDICDEDHTNHTILRPRFFDEVDESVLVADFGFNFQFTDNYNVLNLSHTDTNNGEYICTNIPTSITYNFDTTGTLQLEKEDYVDRIYAYNEDNSFISTNNPYPNKNFYLIRLSSSTTVIYSWQSTNYQYLDGIMNTYRCDNSGDRTLVSTTTISDGRAQENIELLTQAYSYEVIIDEVSYNESAYHGCHFESEEQINYFVTLQETAITPVLGLFFATCDLELVNDNQVTMTWSRNLELEDEQVQACIVGYRHNIRDQSEVYRECSTSSTYTFTATIPDNNNLYTIKGEISQDENTHYCSDIITKRTNNNGRSIFGNTGILAVVLLIFGAALMYAGKGMVMNIVTSIIFILGYFIGMVELGWIPASAALSFMIIVGFIARMSRRSEG